ncbi:MAG: hypothetical protein GDA40_06555 [Rhodobacteraceae bacterium]|nr:hypothetical protein [Paracoccaceae bacterium]
MAVALGLALSHVAHAARCYGHLLPPIWFLLLGIWIALDSHALADGAADP